MEYSLKKIQSLINNNSFYIKKKFGQNFIIDENIINNIITKSQIDDKTMVIEVGPGLGALTEQLAKKAKGVLCYEIDKTLKPFLDKIASDNSNVEVIYNDFLKANICEDLTKYNYEKLYFVSNLPYYITTPIIVKIIDNNIPITKIIIMVQKEVGDRFKAQPGTKDYSSLSVFLNYYYDIKKLLDISRNVFLPKPNVDSIILELSKKEKKYYVINEKLFFEVVRSSFQQKRKTIKNNLSKYNLVIIEQVLQKHDLNLSVRAERISIEIFIDIANALSETN